MKPLAYTKRPTTFDDIIGQDHLVGPSGIIRRMVTQNKLFSLILYGPPGTGKTSIASIIASYYPLNVYEFNASTDNKLKLKDIADGAKYYDNILVIIDEIHRMKKDVQDFLLPFLENGSMTIVGLTTNNPYNSINPAIRSRCHIYKLNEITKNDIIALLKKTIATTASLAELKINDEIIEYLATSSGLEIRTALNMLESVSLLAIDEISLENVAKLIGKKALRLDGGEDYYYDLLSALIKSIRGSDPDAAILYLARLLVLGDLDIICRRLIISAYEDIGLANPAIGPKVMAACEAALKVGVPEARIPLGVITIDLALSPKSNSGYMAVNSAIMAVEEMDNLPIPINILNREIKGNSSLYKYPHDYPDDYVVQQYMPKGMENVSYYSPKENSNYERALKTRLDELNARKAKK